MNKIFRGAVPAYHIPAYHVPDESPAVPASVPVTHSRRHIREILVNRPGEIPMNHTPVNRAEHRPRSTVPANSVPRAVRQQAVSGERHTTTRQERYG